MFAVVVFFLFHPVIRNSWLFDDPYILRNIVEYGIVDFFKRPEVWNRISPGNLTPWVTLSYGIDYAMFGLRHQFYYGHQLISIWLVSVALYAVLKNWATPFFALCGTLLFLGSAPVAASAEILMTRHYIEGLFMSLLAFAFFVRAVKDDSVTYSLIASVFFFFSISAKEVYVPLPIVLLFLPKRNIKKRLLFLLPFTVILIAYFSWRSYMLGNLVSGFTGQFILNSYKVFAPALLLKNFYGSLVMMSGFSTFSIFLNPVVAGLILLLVALSCAFLARARNYAALSFFCVLFFCTHFIPFSVMSLYSTSLYDAAPHDITIYRLALVMAAYNSTVVALAANVLYKYARQGIRSDRVIIAKMIPVFLVGLIVFIGTNTFFWIAQEKKMTLRPFVEEAKFFMNADKGSLLVKTNLGLAVFYYDSLDFLMRHNGKEQSPLVVYDYFAFIDNPTPRELSGIRVFEYSSSLSTMTEITVSFLKERKERLEKKKRLPFAVNLSVNRATIRYSMGPINSGRYLALIGYKPGVYCTLIESRELAPTTLMPGLRAFFRFGWQSPDGWVTFSPEWLIDFSKDESISWKQE